MKENKRKCLKCGSSPADDPETVLFRFPKPGSTNLTRCELWAKYCCPDKPWSSVSFQAKLHSEHRMLCHRHFKETAFIDNSLKKLRRFASPDVEEMTMPFLAVSDITKTRVGPAQPLLNITNETVTRMASMPEPSNSPESSNIPGPSDLPGPSNLHLPGPSNLPGHSKLFGFLNLPGPSNISRCSNLQEQHAYVKCKKYLRKICQLKKQIRYMKNKRYLQKLTTSDAVSKLSNKISPTFALLLQAQIKNFKRHGKGRRWTTDDKITALRLYKRSPTCYRLLKRMFCLPAPTTLKVLLNKCSMDVGINKQIFEIIKQYLSQEEANEFILMFDEMSIKKHLQYNSKFDKIEGFQDHGVQGRSLQPVAYALVFMIAGIRRKVKQPIAYYLSGSSVTADRLTVLIKEVLWQCHEYGINISATVCDMDGVNRKALTTLGATVSSPYFTINHKEIVALFDAPHLIKCFRNLFLKYDIKCDTDITSTQGEKGTGIARWSHIVQFYELDNCNKNFVFAPSLKQEHLNPNTKQKMKVKLAVQVLSHTVAAGMYAKISQGLSSDAIVTADVVSKMDKLFDTLNSDTADLRRGKPFATNLKLSTPHIAFIREMKAFFQKITFIGSTRKPPSQEGWVWTLNGVERLWETLRQKHKAIKSLATRRLQQDPLENLFGCIRGNCGANCNPTTGQFVAGLKTAILSNLSHIGGGNCEIDENEGIIHNLKLFLKPKIEYVTTHTDKITESSSVLAFRDLQLDQNILEECEGETQACTYVDGFIIKNYEHECTMCKLIFTTTDRTIMHTFIHFKEYVDYKESLKYVNKNFVLCVESCATVINDYLKTNAHEKKLMEHISLVLKKNISFDFLNSCIEHKEKNLNYIIKCVSLIIIKRFCVLKNRFFAQETSINALKKKINILKHQ